MRYAGALAIAFFSAAIGLSHFAQPAIAADVPVAPASAARDTGIIYAVEWPRYFGPGAAQPAE